MLLLFRCVLEKMTSDIISELFPSFSKYRYYDFYGKAILLLGSTIILNQNHNYDLSNVSRLTVEYVASS